MLFRNEHRDSFISYVNDAFKSVENETDQFLRKEKMIEKLKFKIEMLKIHASIGPDYLLKLIPGLSSVSKDISKLMIGPRGSKRRSFHHLLHRPLNPNDRWLYQFIKK